MLARIAENLYWMGRYLERAENTARILEVQFEATAQAAPEWPSTWWRKVLDAFEAPAAIQPAEKAVVSWLAEQGENPNGLRSCLYRVHENARLTRFYLNLEIWEAVNRLRRLTGIPLLDEPVALHQFCTQICQASHLVMGITEVTLPRDQAFYLVRCGRYLERADTMLRTLGLLAAVSPEPALRDHQFRSLLRSVSALEAYRKRFRKLEAIGIGQFLLLDSDFPRSVRFSLSGLHRSLEALRRLVGGSDAALRDAGRLAATLEYCDSASEVLEREQPGLEELLARIAAVHVRLSQQYFYLGSAG